MTACRIQQSNVSLDLWKCPTHGILFQRKSTVAHECPMAVDAKTIENLALIVIDLGKDLRRCGDEIETLKNRLHDRGTPEGWKYEYIEGVGWGISGPGAVSMWFTVEHTAKAFWDMICAAQDRAKLKAKLDAITAVIEE